MTRKESDMPGRLGWSRRDEATRIASLSAAGALALVPLNELLDLWSELEQAFHGTNSYGGHVAELYAYRFRRYNPIRANGSGDIKAEAERDDALAAAASLSALLHEFARRRECYVYVGVSRQKWRPIGPWLARTPFVHREHIQVKPKGRASGT